MHDLAQLGRTADAGASLPGWEPVGHAGAVERFRGQVFGLCYRMLGQRQDAEDAAQETFVRFLKNLHRWDQARDFQPWLFAIAGNRCRTALAARCRRPATEAAVDWIPDDAPDPRPAQNLAEEVRLGWLSCGPSIDRLFYCFMNRNSPTARLPRPWRFPWERSRRGFTGPAKS